MTPSLDYLRDALRSPLLPFWLVIALLPFGRSADVGTALCLIGVVLLLLRHRDALREHSGARMLLVLLACYIGAAAFSCIDAVRPGRSWLTALGLLRYMPLGLYACFAIRRRSRLDQLYLATAAVVALWALDTWMQAVTGWSLAGRSAPDRLSGIFGADNLKLGPALAVLSPLALWAGRRYGGWPGLIGAMLLLLGPILLAGSRAAWIIYAVVIAAALWQQAGSGRRFIAYATGALFIGALAGGIAWTASPRFDARVQRTLDAFGGSQNGIDQALTGRLDIWRTSARMIAAHPFNGVGVRDFRYAYPQFAPPNDHFVVSAEACGVGEGACHAHQIVLEILTETGAIGLLAWVIGLGLALRYAVQCGPIARARAAPVSVALVAMLFPLNTHLAFYSAWWGLLFAWLLGLWCAALAVYSDEELAHAA